MPYPCSGPAASAESTRNAGSWSGLDAMPATILSSRGHEAEPAPHRVSPPATHRRRSTRPRPCCREELQSADNLVIGAAADRVAQTFTVMEFCETICHILDDPEDQQ